MIETFKSTPVKRAPAKLVYLAIQERADEEGWASFPYSELRNVTGLGLNGVIRLMKKLVEEGVIERRLAAPHTNDPNRYRIIN